MGYRAAARIENVESEAARPDRAEPLAAEAAALEATDLEATESDALLELGDRIVLLAAHLHAGTHRLLAMIAEFDERAGWQAGGHRSCAHWLAYHTGFDLGACREKVRAARALSGLPLTSAAMARGELSFAKVRALTRLATSDNEADLLAFARSGTAAQVEQLVRSWKALTRVDERERERVLHRSRTVSVVADEDGMYVIRGRLDPEVGALLMRAIEAAGDALYARERDGCGRRDPDREEVTPAQRRADALGLLAERALAAGFGDEDRAPVSGTRAARYQVVLHVDPDTLDSEREPARSHLADGTRVSAETSRRIACDTGVVRVASDAAGRVLDVGRRTRTIPPAIRRALEVRDRGCRFPGCGLRFADAHHIVHWGDGGETKLDNLVLLCRQHHRLVHEDGWRVAYPPGGLPEFESPDGRTIRRSAPRPRDLGLNPVRALVRENERQGLHPTYATPMARWKRDVDMDLGVLMAALEALDVSAFDALDVSAETRTPDASGT